MKKIILKGKRVTLRPLELKDAPLYVRWFHDKDVTRHLAMQERLTLRKEKKYIRDLVKKKDRFNLAIITEDGRYIGASGANLYPKDKRAAIGIFIGEKSVWGKGYATETLTLVADYLFKKLGYRRVELEVSMHNKRALHVYEKIGFTLEGIKRKSHWNIITKKFDDHGMMSILRNEWSKRK